MNQPRPSPRLQPTLANRLKWIRYFIKFSVRYGHWDFFSDFNIEINTSCNRRCAYCPNSVFERGLIKNEQRMDEALYHKLIDELATINFRGRLSPQLYGEPLLDPRLIPLMAYTRAKLPKVHIVLISNGDALTVDTFHALIEAGVDKFSITQHGESMSNNMQALFAHLENNDKLLARIRYNRFDADTPLYNRGGLIQPARVNTVPRCTDPGNPVAIDYAGNVILCCHDYLSSVVFGNIRTDKFLDIWFSPRYRAIRKQLRNGEYRLPICRKCTGQEASCPPQQTVTTF